MAVLHEKLNRLRTAFRKRYLAYGLSRLGLVVCAIAASSFACDYLFVLPIGVRGVVLAAAAVAIGLTVWRHLVRPLLLPITDDDMALTYEAAFPESSNLLVSAVQLGRQVGRPDYPWSRSLTEELLAEADRFAARIDPSALRSTAGLRRSALWAGAALLSCAALAGAFPAETGIWFQRFLLGNTRWPRSTQLALQYPPTVVRGADAEIVVRAIRGNPTQAWIDYTTGGVSATIRLSREDGRPREFRTVFRQLLDTLEFRARGGDDETDWQTVSVRIPPRVEKVELSYRLPAYTGLSAPVRSTGGGVDVLAGSRVEFAGLSDQPLEAAWLLVKQKEEMRVPLEVKGTAIRGEFAVVQRGEYTVHLKGLGGLENTDPSRFPIEVRPDRPPAVAILHPARDMNVLADSKIPLAIEIEDDFGTKEARLQFMIARAGRPAPTPDAPQILNLPIPGDPKKVRLTHLFELGALGLAEGDEVSYSVVAQDANDVTGPGIGQSAPYKFLVVSRETMEEQVDNLGAEVLNDIESMIDLQNRTMGDTKDLSGIVAGKGKYEEVDLRRLVNTHLYQEQVTSMSDQAVAKLAGMIDQIRLFGLSQMQIVDRLEAAGEILREAGRTEATEAAKLLKGAPSRVPPEELLNRSAEKQRDVLRDLVKAHEVMVEFARMAEVIRGVKGVIDRQRAVRHEVIEKIKGKK